VVLDTDDAYRFEATGSVIFNSAAIGKTFSALGARLDGCGVDALNLSNAVVDGSVKIDKTPDKDDLVELTGCLRLEGATIHKDLRIANVRTSPSAIAGAWTTDGVVEKPTCFHFRQLAVNGRMDLSRILAPGDNAAPPAGRYLLNGATVGRLVYDRDNVWPQAGQLYVDSFTYNNIEFRVANVPINRTDDNAVDDYLAWLDIQLPRDIKNEDFKPQPYEQLAAVLRAQGRPGDADKVAIKKRDLAIRYSSRPWWSQLSERSLRLVSGYGYRPGRALVSTLILWGVGIALVWGGVMTDVIELKSEHPDRPRAVINYVGPGPGPHGLVLEHVWKSTPGGCPNLAIPVYALELMAPIPNLGQIADCRMEGRGLVGGVTQASRALYQILGAIMVAILGVTMTGLIRKD